MTSFALLKILFNLMMPPSALAVGVVLSLLLRLLRWRRLATAVLTLSIVYTLVLAFPPVGDGLVRYLEDKTRVAEQRAPACCYDAIVVLGGGISPAQPPDRPLPDLADGSDRIWHAARLWRRGVAPRIIVSGGSYLAQTGGPPATEADAMREFLLDLGVPADVIVNEALAINTVQNIRNVKAIVGDGRVALVTSASHMPRALQIAAREGLKAEAFPVDYLAVAAARLPWDNWLLTLDAMLVSTGALKEILALNFDNR